MLYHGFGQRYHLSRYPFRITAPASFTHRLFSSGRTSKIDIDYIRTDFHVFSTDCSMSLDCPQNLYPHRDALFHKYPISLRFWPHSQNKAFEEINSGNTTSAPLSAQGTEGWDPANVLHWRKAAMGKSRYWMSPILGTSLYTLIFWGLQITKNYIILLSGIRIVRSQPFPKRLSSLSVFFVPQGVVSLLLFLQPIIAKIYISIQEILLLFRLGEKHCPD